VTVSDWTAVLTVVDDAVEVPEPLVIADRFKVASAEPLSLSAVNRAPPLPTSMLIDPAENAVAAKESDMVVALGRFMTPIAPFPIGAPGPVKPITESMLPPTASVVNTVDPSKLVDPDERSIDIPV